MVASPKPYRHLLIFSVCLAILVVALGVFLFAVKIEQVAHGRGVVRGGGEVVVFAPADGRVQLLRSADPGCFASLDPGSVAVDLLPILEIVQDDGWLLARVEVPGRSHLNPRLWLVVDSTLRPGDVVQRGQRLLTLVAVRSAEGDVESPRIIAEFDEKQFAQVRPGQAVRIKSNMYAARTHGQAEGVIASVRPLGRPNDRGERKFVAEVSVERSPFPLLYGSTVDVEVVLGRKETFRVILEH